MFLIVIECYSHIRLKCLVYIILTFDSRSLNKLKYIGIIDFISRQYAIFSQLFKPPDSAANKSYYPKGAIANSFFTDSYLLGKGKEKDLEKRDKTNDVELDISDISWKSDRESKFLDPVNFDR